MVFTYPQKVLFKHCDPAGIVFYPRYFEMMNDCVEAFFDALGYPFEEMHKHGAVPTAQIETRFTAPSRHGDMLKLRLVITKLGRSSATYRMQGFCKEDPRFETLATLVYVNAKGRPTAWPAPIKGRLTDYLEQTT